MSKKTPPVIYLFKQESYSANYVYVLSVAGLIDYVNILGFRCAGNQKLTFNLSLTKSR